VRVLSPAMENRSRAAGGQPVEAIDVGPVRRLCGPFGRSGFGNVPNRARSRRKELV